jgi:hypothetical protein
MATYEEGSEQFPAHIWKKSVDEYDSPVERSSTPHGDFIVSGKGAGRMKWSATHPDSGWEALGTTRNEVRAEANTALKDIIKESKKPKTQPPASEDSI